MRVALGSPPLQRCTLRRAVPPRAVTRMRDSGAPEAHMQLIVQRLRPLAAALPAAALAAESQRAAVLVPLFWRGDGDGDARACLHVLLTQRLQSLSTHGGECAFPGGRRDATDADDAATALREAHEEVGLPPAQARVLAVLPPVLSKHRLSVTPVVALIPADFMPAPHAAEVAAVFELPLQARRHAPRARPCVR